jgi:hypothetical protein
MNTRNIIIHLLTVLILFITDASAVLPSSFRPEILRLGMDQYATPMFFELLSLFLFLVLSPFLLLER